MNNHPPYSLQFHLKDLPPFAIRHGLQAPRLSDHVVVENLLYCVTGICWIYPRPDALDVPTTVEVSVEPIRDRNGPIRYE